MIEENRFVGKGWGFPVRTGGDGGIDLVGGHREIDEAIAIIIGTSPGERVMRPEFGCRIHELVFAPVNAETVALAGRYVQEALGRWEPRIEVDDVDVEIDAEANEAARLLMTVKYTVKATKDERSLVYPFYLIEQESA